MFQPRLLTQAVSPSLLSNFQRTLLASFYYTDQPARANFKLKRAKHIRKLFDEHNKSNVVSNENESTQLSNLEKDESQTDFKKNPSLSQSTDSEYLYGIHPIFSALEANKRTFETLYVRLSTYKRFTDDTISNSESFGALSGLSNSIWREVHERGISILPVHKNKLDKLANYGMHQGLVMMSSPLRLPWISGKTLHSNAQNGGLWILINKVFDPMNLGALIRTATYFGVSNILISSNCSRVSPVVSKASSGAMEFAPIQSVKNIGRVISTLVELGWDVVGTSCSTEGTVPLSQVSPRKNTLVIIGNEGYGVDEEVLDMCTTKVNIPASSSCPVLVDSLNVSVAAGVVLHHFSNVA